MPKTSAVNRSVKKESTEDVGRIGRRRGKHFADDDPQEAVDQQPVVYVARTEETKEKLLAKKKKELEAIVDRHDTLVRELFHTEYYLTLLDYNPAQAKDDNSEVFQTFKARYDLLDGTLPTSTRSTRASRAVKMELLQPVKPATPSQAAGRSASPSKPKSQNKWMSNVDVPPVAKQRDPLASVHRSISSAPSLRSEGDSVVRESISVGVRRKRNETQPAAPEASASASVPVKRRRLTQGVTEDSSARKRTLRSRNTASEAGNMTESPITAPLANALKSKVPLPGEQALSTPTPILSPSKIKRIKLLVRRPPPTLTHPRQIPPPPKFNKSLTAFFDSYTTLRDRDVVEEDLQKQASADISLLNRVEEFRKQGRFIRGADIFVGQNLTSLKSGTYSERKSKDHWDHLLAEASEFRRSMFGKTSGQYIAAQIAGKIKAYWEAQAAKKDKQRMQEEKRLRALAKATIKVVAAEWKKAVFYIREQERLKHEAEERRRGHEHLDAILDQSGQILETQHLDLSRADRSRTSSVSLGSQAGDSDDDEMESDEEQEQEDEQTIDGDAQDGVSDDEDDIGQLLSGPPIPSSEQDEGSETMIPSSEPPDILDEVDDYLQHPSSDQVLEELLDYRSSSPAGPSSSAPSTGRASPAPLPLTATLEDEAYRSMIPDSDDTEVPSTTDSPLGSGLVKAQPAQPADALRDAPSSDSQDQPPKPIDDLIVDSMHASARLSSDGAMSGKDAGKDVEQELDETPEDQSDSSDEEIEEGNTPQSKIPHYLKPFAVAPVEWNTGDKIVPPSLLRGVLRPYQQAGLEWLASLHTNNLNGILADEMGLGKTIQTISLLAHLACDRGIWGPHLIIVPTSVLLNWEMEFKKFLPGFNVLAYHGTTKRRKELRQGWNDKFHFNVCITSYALASRDAHIFKRKAWYYMILDEAHMIKNFKSQRWNILLMFRSFRRLLLTGTPLQNNLTELWALLQFLMSGSHFANLKEFADWFSNPLEKAIEAGDMLDDETLQRVSKLHTVLRPYLLRRIKRDVEKELPSKFEHVVLCPLSKRQRFLYDEFMSRAQTRDALQSGVYQKIANILMQLRKVCNHPDLFEVRPIVTSFAMERSAIADFEIKDLLLRRRLLTESDENHVNFELLGLHFLNRQNTSQIGAVDLQRLDASPLLPHVNDDPGTPPPADYRTISGFAKYTKWANRAKVIARWAQMGYVNRLRCNRLPIYSTELLSFATRPFRHERDRAPWEVVVSLDSMWQSWESRAESMSGLVEKFAFVTPQVVAPGIARQALTGVEDSLQSQPPEFDQVLHQASVKLQIAFPDPSLLQYDCGKLQTLANLLREKKAGGHRVLIFTQMTRVLDILETFLNFNGYLYLRLDGATKIEDRQYITERFNADSRVFAFIASSRSGGVGINLTGADTVIFYDSDFNPQMDKQCEDRAHRIGQIRDVHIYRLVSQHTVEEALLRKANQKRSLDDLVIQKGEFDWRRLFSDENALSRALEEFEDREDVHAAAVAAREEFVLEGADEADFGGDIGETLGDTPTTINAAEPEPANLGDNEMEIREEQQENEEEEGGTVVEYMVSFVEQDWEYFKEWRM